MANRHSSNPPEPESASTPRRFVIEVGQLSGELDADVMHDLVCEGLVRWNVGADRVSVNEEAGR